MQARTVLAGVAAGLVAAVVLGQPTPSRADPYDWRYRHHEWRHEWHHRYWRPYVYAPPPPVYYVPPPAYYRRW